MRRLSDRLSSVIDQNAKKRKEQESALKQRVDMLVKDFSTVSRMVTENDSGAQSLRKDTETALTKIRTEVATISEVLDDLKNHSRAFSIHREMQISATDQLSRRVSQLESGVSGLYKIEEARTRVADMMCTGSTGPGETSDGGSCGPGLSLKGAVGGDRVVLCSMPGNDRAMAHNKAVLGAIRGSGKQRSEGGDGGGLTYADVLSPTPVGDCAPAAGGE